MQRDVFFTSEALNNKQIHVVEMCLSFSPCLAPPNQRLISQFPFGGGIRPHVCCFAWRLHVKRLTLDGWEVWKVTSFAIHKPLDLSSCVQSFSCAPFSCWRYTARACSVWLKPTLTDTFHRTSIHRPLDRPSNRPLDQPSHRNNKWRIKQVGNYPINPIDYPTQFIPSISLYFSHLSQEEH